MPWICTPWHFNPRPSYEGRRVESDSRGRHPNFNPRPSYEGRLHEPLVVDALDGFQSTPLIRGATAPFARVARRT